MYPKEIPVGFDVFVEQLMADIDSVEGHLSAKEIRFLALLAAVPRADGAILEIGSFKGRSTCVLARSAALIGDETVYAVDPMTAPSETDPDLRGAKDTLADFRRNIEAAGVADRVELHQTFSYELAKTWDRPLRLLWIDGDHTYLGTRLDLEGFSPHLNDGAIVAMHDVLHEFDGGVRVMMEHILLSPNFGACGFVGSIGWGQYLKDTGEAAQYRDQKLRLYKKLSRMIPFLTMRKEPLSGFEKKRYKVARALVPHGELKPQEWLRLVR